MDTVPKPFSPPQNRWFWEWGVISKAHDPPLPTEINKHQNDPSFFGGEYQRLDEEKKGESKKRERRGRRKMDLYLIK
jgi:hypothetical protein